MTLRLARFRHPQSTSSGSADWPPAGRARAAGTRRPAGRTRDPGSRCSGPGQRERGGGRVAHPASSPGRHRRGERRRVIGRHEPHDPAADDRQPLPAETSQLPASNEDPKPGRPTGANCRNLCPGRSADATRPEGMTLTFWIFSPSGSVGRCRVMSSSGLSRGGRDARRLETSGDVHGHCCRSVVTRQTAVPLERPGRSVWPSPRPELAAENVRARVGQPPSGPACEVIALARAGNVTGRSRPRW